jgi:hypothetical protein
MKDKLGFSLSEERKASLKRQAAFGLGLVAPSVVGSVGKRGGESLLSGRQFGSTQTMARAAKPGDLLMVGRGHKPFYWWKSLASLGTGAPEGYHAAIVGSVDRKKGTMEVFSLEQGGYKKKSIQAGDLDNFSLVRITDRGSRLAAHKNMRDLVRVQAKLDRRLAAQGMPDGVRRRVFGSIYRDEKIPTIGIKELLFPQVRDKSAFTKSYRQKAERDLRFLTKNVNAVADDIYQTWKETGKLDTRRLNFMKGVCTTTSAKFGVPLSAKADPRWASPNDLLRSGKVKTVGYKVSPRSTRLVKTYNRVLKAAPTAIRLALGVGFGTALAGAVAGKQAVDKKKRSR